jgi:hypothetical protein
MCSRNRQRGVYTYKESSSFEDTTINVQQEETERSAHIQGTKQIGGHNNKCAAGKETERSAHIQGANCR